MCNNIRSLISQRPTRLSLSVQRISTLLLYLVTGIPQYIFISSPSAISLLPPSKITPRRFLSFSNIRTSSGNY